MIELILIIAGIFVSIITGIISYVSGFKDGQIKVLGGKADYDLCRCTNLEMKWRKTDEYLCGIEKKERVTKETKLHM